jgi:hypothetical protein
MSTAASTVTAPLPASAIVRRDFPAWLPPMLIKELRQGLRTRGFVGALLVFQVVMLLLMLTALGNQAGATAGSRSVGSSLTSGFFWTLMSVMLLLVTPSRALGGLQLEVESRTLDLLMLTRLNAWGIVLGKWISLLAQAALLLVAMLPYLVVRYFTDNADIVADLGVCLALLGVSAVLTAAALWASGIGKVLRVVIVILLVFSAQTLSGVFFGGAGIRGAVLGASRTNPLLSLLDSPFHAVNAALITAFFLISAVRNIAPPAENHCFFTRVLPLVALLTAPFAEIVGAHDVAVRQLLFGAGFLAFVLLFELGRPRWPLAAQWREWQRRGFLLRMAGRCALPGWESAFLYGVLGTLIWSVFALVVLPSGTVTSQEIAEHAVWLALLGLAGLTFPAVMMAMLRPLRGSPLLVYFCLLSGPPLVAGFGVLLSQTKWKILFLRAVAEVLPVSSFMFAAQPAEPQPIFIVLFAGVFALAVFAGAFALSRAYWQQLVLFDARDRKERGLT